MKTNNMQELLEALKGKRYLLLGVKDEKYAVLDISNSMIKAVSKTSLAEIASQLYNLKVEKGVPTAVDISATRLEKVMAGITSFAYVVQRYKDSTDKTMGYLIVLYSNGHGVQVMKLSNTDSMRLFEQTAVLNAKRVVRDGQEIIAGIVAPLTELVVETGQTKNKETADAHIKYLDKYEEKLERNFMQNGYAVKKITTKDEQKQAKRYVAERIKEKMPELYAWAIQKTTKKRIMQAIDAYTAERFTQGKLKYKRPSMVRRAVTKLHPYQLGEVKDYDVLILESHTTFGLPTVPLALSDYAKAQEPVLITTSKDGAINISGLEAIKDAKTLQQGMKNKELVLYKLNGVLADTDGLPVSESTVGFLQLRDAQTLEFNIKKFYNQVLDKDRKNPLIHIKYYSQNIKLAHEDTQNYISHAELDFSSNAMFNQMGYIDNVGMFRDNSPMFHSYVEPRSFEDVLGSVKGITYDNIKYVGDIIILDEVLNKERKRTVDYALLTLLAHNNKPLFREFMESSVGSNYVRAMNMSLEDIDTLESYEQNVVYQSGGKIGDNDHLLRGSNIFSFERHSDLDSTTALKLSNGMKNVFGVEVNRIDVMKGIYKLR